METAESENEDQSERIECKVVLGIGVIARLLDIVMTKLAWKELRKRTKLESQAMKLQHDATWVLAYVAYAESKQIIGQLCKLGCIDALVSLLKHTKDMWIAHGCLWGLANIAGDSVQCRNKVLKVEFCVCLFVGWLLGSFVRVCVLCFLVFLFVRIIACI